MIHNSTYHILVKEHRSTENVDILLNPDVLPVDDSTDKLLANLTERYRGRAGKGYGKFEENTDSYPTSTILEEYLDVNIIDGFHSCTERLMKHLMAESKDEAGAKGGKVAFIHYSEGNQEYFLVAILTEKVGITAKDWTLTQNDVLNFENVRFAGRVNISSWKAKDNEKQRYVSFLKGQGEVSNYFKRFMGCSDVLMANQETKDLVAQIKLFATSKDLKLEERAHLLKNANEYLRELADNKPHPLQFSMHAFTNRVWPNEPQDLVDFFEGYGEENGCSISDGFVPDKGSLRGLAVQFHRTKHWAFSFDDEAISDDDVTVTGGKVIFHKPPQDILDAYDKGGSK
ncbi:nucleoid-associated protein [Psychrobacter sp. AT9]|uniref:nucleoid-associated protein n=1 Tax=Psychrobacter sp. AT9 TaxID=3242893 RepID=UPI0039A473C4